MSELDAEKLFYERFWNLHRDAQLVELFKRYGPTAFRRSSVLEGFEAFIKAQKFVGECCIEIGTLKGLTALVLARHFQRVITIDIIDDPQKREIADMLGVRNIEFFNIRDNEEKADIILASRFDAAYVDGNHTKDTQTDFALVRKCGRVLFHEAWDAQPPVMQLLASLSNVTRHGKFALWHG